MVINEFVRKRITDLRTSKGVSEYKMSLELGHSRGYIQSITSGRMLPSMSEFIAICEYLDTTPADFFNEKIEHPALTRQLMSKINTLSKKELEVIDFIIDKFQQPHS